ncbi:FMN-binding negative transcriptional regulator [Pseudomonas sp. S9]|uniref:FMN-binding negative transcriptional regulator n=1 Tax=Pseudomonas sp. S9 TaxID=686578 RepID=UPI00025566ED|nr:FMN-binding negative transcriptional regulator [Pseudomonas sp. S9]
MYLPTAFRQDDLGVLHEEIDKARLATVVSHGASGFQATHLPVLLIREEGQYGTLYGHLARANPHWRDWQAGSDALVMFNTTDGYISPAWYPAKAEHGKVVPTWNYISVHARGPIELFDDPQRLLQLVSRLSDKHEAPRQKPWSVDDAPADYIDKMLRAIVGFALPIAHLEGKYKLSQNRDPADRQGVRAGLQSSTDPRDQLLAGRMPCAD